MTLPPPRSPHGDPPLPARAAAPSSGSGSASARPLRIALDARMLGERLHGIGRYVWSLTDHLARLAPQHELVLLGSDNPHTRQLVGTHRNVALVPARSRPFSLGEHLELPRLLRAVRPDLFHAMSTALPLPALLPCPYVMTVHDLIPLVYPGCGGWFHELYYRGYLRFALRSARRVMTVASVGRDDLARELGRARALTDVVFNGVEPIFAPLGSDERDAQGEPLALAPALAALGVRAPYLLVMGNPRPHKNLGTALQVFARLASTELAAQAAELGGSKTLAQLQLVVVSSDAPHLRSAIATHPARDRILHLQHVSDEALPLLYRHCRVFFCPSLCEGFGLPLAEAMASGAVCVSSTATSLGEVLGGGGVGVDARPERAHEVALGLLAPLLDPALRTELRARALRQAARFTWEGCATQVLAIYEQACSQPQGR